MSRFNYLIYKRFSERRDFRIISEFMTRHGYPEADRPGEFSLLIIAIQLADEELVDFLIEAGYKINLDISTGDTVFHQALTHKSDETAISMFKCLRKYGEPSFNRDANGLTVEDILKSRNLISRI